MAAVAHTLLTAEELEGRTWPDALRRELVRGEVVEMSPAGRTHGRVAARFARLLGTHVEERGLGEVYAAETGFVLSRDPDTVLAPDASFVRAERLVGQDEDRFLRLAPDLAMEVVSPSDSASEVHEKVMQYLDAGVRMVIVLHPKQRTATVYGPDGTAQVLREGDVLTGGAVLPELRIAVADLFR